ncbi:MAG: nucleotidyltransferase family protein [Chloroflexi bacterium]|nr:nucleotidyltransferase family protein [Chloroflexota bacterium]
MQVNSDSVTRGLQRDEVIKLLQSHKEELRKFGVLTLALFGSVVRDEARPDSDVDLLVEFEARRTLFDYARLERYLEGLLGTKVDLVVRRAVIPELRDIIFREAVNVL